MDARQKQIDRIVKLFRLGDADRNDNEAELLLAITKARQLMVQNNISMAEIETARGGNVADAIRASIRQHCAYTRKGKNLAEYDKYTAWAVGHLTETKPLIVRRETWTGPTTSIEFVGQESDTLLASELFIIWLKDVRRLARRLYGSGNVWNIRHTSYAIGLSSRMSLRAQEMVVDLTPGQTETQALVVRSKETAIQQHMTDAGVTEEKPKTLKLHHEAFVKGQRDGEGFNLNTNVLKSDK